MTTENSETTDPFEGFSPLPGLEHLGRAIVDSDGQPSGSPANYENLRGYAGPDQAVEVSARPLNDVLSELVATLPTAEDLAHG